MIGPCAKEHRVCAKCCCRVERIVGRDVSEVEAEQKMLEEAIKNASERERRSLLRAAILVFSYHVWHNVLFDDNDSPDEDCDEDDEDNDEKVADQTDAKKE
ncbi:hypothetical protein TSUD_285250 [Trifolium subterraneum]|uniref:Uncharacterized protein n=1 Tax=Trifolium subterraneum TaxID=3900 RepID=A0A2Z6PDV2_TRISU|nr:hypothetical protein TSUD_285250 [Trifolium subterraneum]